MRDIYKNTFTSAALDIAVCGWTHSKVPENVKDWCARDLCQKLPDHVIKELFTRLVTEPHALSNCTINFPKNNNNTGDNSSKKQSIENNNNQSIKQQSDATSFNNHSKEAVQQSSNLNSTLSSQNVQSTTTTSTTALSPILSKSDQLRILTSDEENENTKNNSSLPAKSCNKIKNNNNNNQAVNFGNGRIPNISMRELIEKVTMSAMNELSSMNDSENTKNKPSTPQLPTPQRQPSTDQQQRTYTHAPPPLIKQEAPPPPPPHINPIALGLKQLSNQLNPIDANIQQVLAQYQSGNLEKDNLLQTLAKNFSQSPIQSTPIKQEPIQDKRFFCEKCGKTFKNNAGFKMHLRSHLIKDGKIPNIKNGGNPSAATFASTAASLLAHMHDNVNSSPITLASTSPIAKQSSGGGPGSSGLGSANTSFTSGSPNPTPTLNGLPVSNNGPSDIPPETTISQIVGDDGEKRHRCDICGYTSKRYADLRDHQRIHSDERPFQCNICFAKFKQRQTLRNHRRNVHKVSGLDNIPCIPGDGRVASPSTKRVQSPNIGINAEQLMNLTQQAKQSINVPSPSQPSNSLAGLLEQLTNGMGANPSAAKKQKTESSESAETNISDAEFANMISSATKTIGQPKVSELNKENEGELKPDGSKVENEKEKANGSTSSDSSLTNATLSSLLTDQFNVNNIFPNGATEMGDYEENKTSSTV